MTIISFSPLKTCASPGFSVQGGLGPAGGDPSPNVVGAQPLEWLSIKFWSITLLPSNQFSKVQSAEV